MANTAAFGFINRGYDALKTQFQDLEQNQTDSASKMALALTECLGGGALLATRSITKNFTGSLVATVFSIAALVLFLDGLRRVAPVALPKPYATFYNKVPKAVQKVLSTPVKSLDSKVNAEMQKEIAELKDLDVAKQFATQTFKVTLHDKLENLDEVKKLLQAASTAKTTFEHAAKQHAFLAQINDKTQAGYTQKLKELYQDKLVAKVHYANALMVLQIEDKKPYVFKNDILTGIDSDVSKFATQEDLEDLVFLKLGSTTWTSQAIENMHVDDAEESSEWQKLINKLGEVAPKIENKDK